MQKVSNKAHGMIVCSVSSLFLYSSLMVFFSADGKTLRLEYTSNDLACSSKHRRSDNLKTKTIIRFECGNSVGGPVYIPRSVRNNQFYKFANCKIYIKFYIF